MGLSATAKARGLRGAMAGNLALGLGTTIVEDGGVMELVDNGYARMPLDLALRMDGNDAEMYNRNTIDFPPFDDDVEEEQIRYWFILDETGELRASGELTPKVINGVEVWTPHEAGWSVRFRPGDVTVRLADQGE